MSQLGFWRRNEEKHDRDFAVVVAGGSLEMDDLAGQGLLARARLTIAADSGGLSLIRLSLVPEIFVGDFDSCPLDEVEALRKRGSNIVHLRVDKDKTDTEVALDIALEKGFRKVFLLGALGGCRPEHSLANLSLLETYAKKGMDVIIHSKNTLVCGLLGSKDPLRLEDSEDPREKRLSSVTLNGSPNDWVSLLPVTRNVTGVSTEGLKFPLKHGVLKRGFTLGVSNQMLKESAEVAIDQGFLLLVLTKNC